MTSYRAELIQQATGDNAMIDLITEIRLLYRNVNLLLGCLDSGLGDLTSSGLSLLNGLDDSDSDGLSHVSDGESA